MSYFKNKFFFISIATLLTQLPFLEVGFAKPAAPVSCLMAHSPSAKAKRGLALRMAIQGKIDKVALRNRPPSVKDAYSAVYFPPPKEEKTPPGKEPGIDGKSAPPPPPKRNHSEPLLVFDEAQAITSLQWTQANHVLVSHGTQDISEITTTQLHKTTLVDPFNGTHNSYRLARNPESHENFLIDVVAGTNFNSQYRFLDKTTYQEVWRDVIGWNLSVFDDLMVFYAGLSNPIVLRMESNYTQHLNASAYPRQSGKVQVLKDVPFLIDPGNMPHTKAIGVWSAITKSFEMVEFDKGPNMISAKDFRFTIGHGDKRALVFSFFRYNALRNFDHEEFFIVKMSDLKAGQLNTYSNSDYVEGTKLSDRYGLFKDKNKTLSTLIDVETGEEFPVDSTPHVLSNRSYAVLTSRAANDSRGALAQIRRLDSQNLQPITEVIAEEDANFRIVYTGFVEGTDFLEVQKSSKIRNTIVAELYNLVSGKKVWEKENITHISVSPDGKQVAYVDRDKKLFVEPLGE